MTSETGQPVSSPQISTASQDRTSRRHDRYASDTEREIKHLRELLQLERQRAEDAEARTRESLAHLKNVNEARIKALQEASQATEELKLYKIQLEAAQIDIYRAQDILKVVDKQRLDAEKEAAELRTRHRKLVEETKVQRAREQGRQQGMKEGIEKGRDLGLLEGRLMGYGQRQRAFEDDEPLSPESNVSSRSRFASPSPRPASRTNSVAPSVVSRRSVGGRSESEAPVPVLPPTSIRSSAPQGTNDGSDYSRPISIRNRTPSPVHSTTIVPPDNYIPFVDADNVIRLPPPHEFHRPPPSASERSSSPLHDSETDDRRPNSRSGTPYRRARRHSSPESNSTTLSQLDLVNDPSSNQVLGTPMSAIPEVSSSQTSPAQQPGSQHAMQRQPSFAGSTRTQGSQRSAAAHGTPADLRVPIYTRPRTTSGSTISAVPPSRVPQHERSQSTLGSGPPISVQPPSSSSGTIANESIRMSTPAGRSPAPLPAEPPSFSMPSPPPERSEFPSPIVLNSGQLPSNFVAMSYTPASSFAQLRPMSNEGNTSSDGPAVIPDSALFGMDSEDSEGSMDTLTTPPPERRRLDLHDRRSSGRNSPYTGAQTSSVVGTPHSARVAAQVPMPPSTIAGTPKSTWGGASGVGAAGIPLPPSTLAGTPSAVGEGVSLPTAPSTPHWGGSMVGKVAGNKSRSSSRSTRRTAN